jgi:hypothetical protein
MGKIETYVSTLIAHSETVDTHTGALVFVGFTCPVSAKIQRLPKCFSSVDDHTAKYLSPLNGNN